MPITYEFGRAVGGVWAPYQLDDAVRGLYVEQQLDRQTKTVDPPNPSGAGHFLVGAAFGSRPQDVGVVAGLASPGDYAAALQYHINTACGGNPKKVEIRRNYDSASPPSAFLAGNNLLDYPSAGNSLRTTAHSFKVGTANMAKLAAGTATTFLAQIDAILAAAPTDHPIWWIAEHEPEDTWNDTAMAKNPDASKANYKAGMRALYTHMKAHSNWTAAAGKWKTCWVMMAYSWCYGGRLPGDWDPGSDVTDIAGVDAYNEGSLANGGTPYWDSPGYQYGRPVTGDRSMSSGYYGGGFLKWIHDNGYKEYFVGEVGSIRNITGLSPSWILSGFSNSKADWIRMETKFHSDYAVSGLGAKCVGWCYFDFGQPGARNYRGPGWVQSTAAHREVEPWSATVTYGKGAYCTYSGRQKPSLQAGNKGNTPGTGTATTAWWDDKDAATEDWCLRWSPGLADYIAWQWARDNYGVVT